MGDIIANNPEYVPMTTDMGDSTLLINNYDNERGICSLPILVTTVSEFDVEKSKLSEANLERIATEAKSDNAVWLGELVDGDTTAYKEMMAKFYFGGTGPEENRKVSDIKHPIQVDIQKTYLAKENRSADGLLAECADAVAEYQKNLATGKIARVFSLFFKPHLDCKNYNCPFGCFAGIQKFKTAGILVAAKTTEELDVLKKLDAEARSEKIKKLQRLRKIAAISFANTMLMTMSSDDDDYDNDNYYSFDNDYEKDD